MFKLKIFRKEKNKCVNLDMTNAGQDHLIPMAEPYAFLAIKNFDLNIVKIVEEVFGLSLIKNKKGEYSLCAVKRANNFKLDILTLLGASLYLFKIHPKCNMFLGVAKTLNALLSEAEKEVKNLELGEELEIDNTNFENSFLSISPSVQLVLKQSGLSSVICEKNRELSNGEVETLWLQFTSTSSMNKILDKVG